MYKKVRLETLPVSKLADSETCTAFCVWERFQPLTYLRSTSVQTSVSGNASSL
ncbi:hypothetical protein DPMN_192230 [Dreissena polymorpha]|uniref:Uncharacterized protein n=1 Tax=Dreissena polymorpha TaxID=45954 RepID=A0A9D3Y0R4_DREPO|nr:hypothetical protein DPMN_192230 [Dreissena polymorpha]